MSDRAPQANQPDRGVYILYITRVSSINIKYVLDLLSHKIYFNNCLITIRQDV